jgi:hypothetical protein
VEENVNAREWGKFVGYSAKYTMGLRREHGWPWLECASTGIESARLKLQEEQIERWIQRTLIPVLQHPIWR